jgi:hypothetical protein
MARADKTGLRADHYTACANSIRGTAARLQVIAAWRLPHPFSEYQ